MEHRDPEQVWPYRHPLVEGRRHMADCRQDVAHDDERGQSLMQMWAEDDE